MLSLEITHSFEYLNCLKLFVKDKSPQTLMGLQFQFLVFNYKGWILVWSSRPSSELLGIHKYQFDC